MRRIRPSPSGPSPRKGPAIASIGYPAARTAGGTAPNSTDDTPAPRAASLLQTPRSARAKCLLHQCAQSLLPPPALAPRPSRFKPAAPIAAAPRPFSKLRRDRAPTRVLVIASNRFPSTPGPSTRQTGRARGMSPRWTYGKWIPVAVNQPDDRNRSKQDQFLLSAFPGRGESAPTSGSEQTSSRAGCALPAGLHSIA